MTGVLDAWGLLLIYRNVTKVFWREYNQKYQYYLRTEILDVPYYEKLHVALINNELTFY